MNFNCPSHWNPNLCSSSAPEDLEKFLSDTGKLLKRELSAPEEHLPKKKRKVSDNEISNLVKFYKFATPSFENIDSPLNALLPLDLLLIIPKNDLVVMMKMACTCKKLNVLLHTPQIHSEFVNENKIEAASFDSMTHLILQCGQKIKNLDFDIFVYYYSFTLFNNTSSKARSFIELDDEKIAEVIKRTPSLEKLTLRHRKEVTGKFLSLVKNDMHDLKWIDLTGCENIDTNYLRRENLLQFSQLETVTYSDFARGHVICLNAKNFEEHTMRKSVFRRLPF